MIPLSITSKKPLNAWAEFQTRTPSHEELDDWFENGAPTTSGKRVDVFNLALVTGTISGIVVVDADNDAAVSYAKKNGLDSPFVVETSRGQHFYHQHPGHGARFPNKVGGSGRDWPQVPGLDFRGDGGYVVMPPSIKVEGGKQTHIYSSKNPIGLSWDDVPVWKGRPDSVESPVEREFSFTNLDLSGVRVPQLDDYLPVHEQISRRVAHLGRKLTEGDGTDLWIVRYAGQKVRQGATGEGLERSIRSIYDEFFEDAYDEEETKRWLEAKIRSAVEMDRRNYPEDYAADGSRIEKAVQDDGISRRLVPIYADDVDRLIKDMGDTAYWVDPIIPAETITQVVGYNGHGKSFFLYALLNSMAAGREMFGPYDMGKPCKVLYLDYDNPRKTVLSRFQMFNQMFGATGQQFALWSPSVISPEDGGEMRLNTEDGFRLLGEWLEVVEPQVVVIDTVRNAFGGLDEVTASEWFRVNHVAKTIRTRHRASVILVHHRNKPGEGGLGREAGSTAQLTDIDTQVLVTQVFREKQIAKTKAGLLDTDLNVTDMAGRDYTPWAYLEQQLEPDSRLRMVTQVSFGKVRMETELHKTHYIGWGERLNDGTQYIVSTRSPRQAAQYLVSDRGMEPLAVSRELHLPLAVIREWVTPKMLH